MADSTHRIPNDRNVIHPESFIKTKIVSKTEVIGPGITVILGQSKRKSWGQKTGRYYGGHGAKIITADSFIKRMS